MDWIGDDLIYYCIVHLGVWKDCFFRIHLIHISIHKQRLRFFFEMGVVWCSIIKLHRHVEGNLMPQMDNPESFIFPNPNVMLCCNQPRGRNVSWLKITGLNHSSMPKAATWKWILEHIHLWTSGSQNDIHLINRGSGVLVSLFPTSGLASSALPMRLVGPVPFNGLPHC